MQIAAIIFLVLWFLAGVYIYRQEAWWSRTEALVEAVLGGFMTVIGTFAFIFLAAGTVALAIGFI